MDEVTVFAATEFRPERYVTVFGEVLRPGELPFAESMTLRALHRRIGITSSWTQSDLLLIPLQYAPYPIFRHSCLEIEAFPAKG